MQVSINMADFKIDLSNCNIHIDKMFDIHDNENVTNVYHVAAPTGQAATADVAKSDELHFDHLPDKLRSPRAKELWRELFKEGYVNSDCLTNRSRVESAIMAHEMAKKLGLGRYWNDFSKIWQMKNLKSAYDKRYEGDNGEKFEKKIRDLFS